MIRKKLTDKKLLQAILKNKLENTTNKRTKQKLKVALKLNAQKSEDTKPEIQTKSLLDSLEIKYAQQFPLCGYIYDFILPEHRILIEVNGGYWHSSPLLYRKSNWNRLQKKNYTRDKKKLGVAISHGYRILYIWEDDLKRRARKVRDRLKIFVENVQKEDKSFHILEEVFPQYKDFYFKKKEKSVINEAIEQTTQR